MLNVILIRGLYGEKYSLGMDVLGEELRKLKGVDYVIIVPYTNWENVARQVAYFKDPTILIGHSYGVTSFLRIARANPDVKFPRAFAFDPSQYVIWGSNQVPNNIDKLVNFYQRKDFPFFGIGSQKLYRADGSTRNIENIYSEPSTHTDIDDRRDLHARVLRDVKAYVNEL